MKQINYLLILVIILSPNVSHITNNQNNSKSTHLISHSNYKISNDPLTEPINLDIYANATNITNTQAISLKITSVVHTTHFYIVFNTQGIFHLLYGLGNVKLNFTFEGISQILYLSFNDFNPINGGFKQLILVYNNITLYPTSNISINMTLDVTSYLNSEYDFSLYIQSLDLFFIEYPLVNPVTIPSWQYGKIAVLGTDLLTGINRIDFVIFLPSNSDVNVSIVATSPIVIKDMEVEHASWVNLPNLTSSKMNFTLSFVTDNTSSLQPRDLTLFYFATTNIPLKIAITAEIVIFTIINPLPMLSQNENDLRLIIASILVFLPISILIKNRKKKLKGIKL